MTGCKTRWSGWRCASLSATSPTKTFVHGVGKAVTQGLQFHRCSNRLFWSVAMSPDSTALCQNTSGTLAPPPAAAAGQWLMVPSTQQAINGLGGFMLLTGFSACTSARNTAQTALTLSILNYKELTRKVLGEGGMVLCSIWMFWFAMPKFCPAWVGSFPTDIKRCCLISFHTEI